MNTLAFVNFLLVKLFPTLIRQNFPLSKICAVQYLSLHIKNPKAAHWDGPCQLAMLLTTRLKCSYVYIILFWFLN